MFALGDCTVTNGRYTSVIHRYCEGKQTCTSFQVDRRFCGANQTTYEQVEYECVPGIIAKLNVTPLTNSLCGNFSLNILRYTLNFKEHEHETTNQWSHFRFSRYRHVCPKVIYSQGKLHCNSKLSSWIPHFNGLPMFTAGRIFVCRICQS